MEVGVSDKQEQVSCGSGFTGEDTRKEGLPHLNSLALANLQTTDYKNDITTNNEKIKKQTNKQMRRRKP